MFYADTVGAAAILAKMEHLAKDDPTCEPALLLRELAATGGKFTKIDTGGLKTNGGA
jgi:3-hydroxyacyl-CoA dehydrogenase